MSRCSISFCLAAVSRLCSDMYLPISVVMLSSSATSDRPTIVRHFPLFASGFKNIWRKEKTIAPMDAIEMKTGKLISHRHFTGGARPLPEYLSA